MSNEKKYLDYEGLQYLWSKISMEDYPNNDTLIAVINAIDENKADKTTTEALQEAINILNGTGEGSVKYTIADAVATIVAQAPEDFDTLKEIADWIANDETGTLDLIGRVEKAEADVEALKPLDVQPDWKQTDETAMDFIKNKPDEDDALEVVSEMGLVEPVTFNDGSICTDENGAIFTLI